MALPPGTRVQDYEIRRMLGHGGFGITYLCRNLTLDIDAAVKEYFPADLTVRERDHVVAPRAPGDEATFQWGLDRFLDEARALERFKHPNIIQMRHCFKAQGTAYIVMEYVRGETLGNKLKRHGTLDGEELTALLLPMLDGLAQVHTAGMLHRDIKPANIMLRETDGSPVLVDFGAARQAIGERSRSLTTILTIPYAPMEQYHRRGQQGPWTDLYALGAVCYRAVTGNLPEEAAGRLQNDPQVPAVKAARGKAGTRFLQAIDWALQVEESDRPQDVAAWRTALLGVAKARREAARVAPDALFDLLEQDDVTVEAVQDLIARGADVCATAEYGYTPLHRAALRNKSPRIIKMLLAAGASLKAKNKYGETPLDLARAKNNWAAAKVLSEAIR